MKQEESEEMCKCIWVERWRLWSIRNDTNTLFWMTDELRCRRRLLKFLVTITATISNVKCVDMNEHAVGKKLSLPLLSSTLPVAVLDLARCWTAGLAARFFFTHMKR